VLYPFKWVLCNDLFALAWAAEPCR
jgi:hypothetical protein